MSIAKTLSISLAVALLALLAPLSGTAATVTINLDSVVGGNSGMLHKDSAGSFYLDANDINAGTNSIAYHTFGPGTYNIMPTKDLFLAWSRWSSASGCDASSGTLCNRGFEHSFAFFMPETAEPVGEVNKTNVAPTDNTKTNLVNYALPFTPFFYEDPEGAFASVEGMVMASFTLGSEQDVGFYIHDNIIGDNRGGVSIDVSAVPLPASLPLLLAGISGFAFIRRKKA
ncbi:VPLPA-CTERM sorting domain-containing protein [Pikeienuella sp. HZG-20]|uniref:VPLPA-CTERM sorting domain-containing protein n=1 Tax=Paludibacillus litoralis TaxID=3133267 RepID=UPI0030ED5846